MLIGLALSIQGVYRLTLPKVPFVQLRSLAPISKADNCEGLSRCVSLILPASQPVSDQLQQLTTAVKKYVASSNKVGLNIVVEAPSPEQLEVLSKQLGEDLLLDDHGKLTEALKISEFPVWAVWDEQRRLYKKTALPSIIPNLTEKELAHWFLSSQLALDEIL